MKKLLITGVVVVGLVAVFGGTDAWYHVKSAFDSIRNEVEDSVAIDTRLDQAEDMIQDLGPEMGAWERKVVEEEVRMDELGKTIEGIDRDLTELEVRLRANADRLRTETVSYSIAGRNYSRSALAHRVNLDCEELKRKRALVETKRRLLAACIRSHSAAEKKLATVKSERGSLRILVEQLRAEFRENEALAATSQPIDVDDSKLAEVKRILQRCNHRLKVERKLLERQGTYTGTHQTAVDASEVIDEVDRYLGRADSAAAESLAPVIGSN